MKKKSRFSELRKDIPSNVSPFSDEIRQAFPHPQLRTEIFSTSSFPPPSHPLPHISSHSSYQQTPFTRPSQSQSDSYAYPPLPPPLQPLPQPPPQQPLPQPPPRPLPTHDLDHHNLLPYPDQVKEQDTSASTGPPAPPLPPPVIPLEVQLSIAGRTNKSINEAKLNSSSSNRTFHSTNIEMRNEELGKIWEMTCSVLGQVILPCHNK